jgi:hypothetical protein
VRQPNNILGQTVLFGNINSNKDYYFSASCFSFFFSSGTFHKPTNTFLSRVNQTTFHLLAILCPSSPTCYRENENDIVSVNFVSAIVSVLADKKIWVKI